MNTQKETRQIRTDQEHSGKGLVELFQELRDESSHLLREEVALAKTEMSEKVSLYARNVGYIATGAAILLSALTFLGLAVTVGLYLGLVNTGLSHENSGWLAPLLTAMALIAVGYSAMQKGISTLKHESPVPERTMETLKDNQKWAKEKVTT